MRVFFLSCRATELILTFLKEKVSCLARKQINGEMQFDLRCVLVENEFEMFHSLEIKRRKKKMNYEIDSKREGKITRLKKKFEEDMKIKGERKKQRLHG